MEFSALQDALYDHFFKRGNDGPVLDANVKKAVVYLCAAKYGDKPGEITKFTGYTPAYVWDRVDWLKRNDQLLNNTVSRSTLLTYIPGGEAIIDAWLPNAAPAKSFAARVPVGAAPKPIPAPDPKPAPKPAPSTAPTPAVVHVGINKSAVIRKAIDKVLSQQESFTWQEIAQVCEQKHGLNGLYSDIDNLLTRGLKNGSLVRLRRGSAKTPALFAKANGAAPIAPKAVAATPPASAPEAAPAAVTPAVKFDLVEVTANAPDVAPVQTPTSIVLPGPEPSMGSRFVDMLGYLKNRALGDVEAINRVMAILEREAPSNV